MRKIAQLCVLAALAAPAAAHADAVTALMDHHVAAMKAGNTDAVMSDYAPGAVVVTPPGMVSPSGVFAGKDARKLFAVLTDKDHVPGNKTMQTHYENVAPDTAIMHWTQFPGSAQQVTGQDVFVVRGGKVVFQSVAVNAK